ncbi:hypothetical protein GCM10015535_27060 [Streptomyces gelaticus]|uniref:Uncharacterized protein n=1 Tax=Streptomyces gelaticus TaxID=285446 RepID=A0ABQ2VY53_9ACTN|nr:hypothetical protein GCM10015535_27060 [Streptomyces gelaticus]
MPRTAAMVQPLIAGTANRAPVLFPDGDPPGDAAEGARFRASPAAAASDRFPAPETVIQDPHMT